MNIFNLRYKELQKYIIFFLLFIIFYYCFFMIPQNATNISIPAQIRFGGVAENGKVQVIAEFNAEEMQGMWLKSHNNNNVFPSNNLLSSKSFRDPISPRDICVADASWIIYVISEAKNFERREILRKTWANYKLYKKPFFRVLFVVGETEDADVTHRLMAESVANGDVMECDGVMEGERSASSKSVCALQWIGGQCRLHTYVIKANDNSFINMFELVPHIHRLVASQPNQQRFIACAIWGEDLMLIQRDASVCGRYCVGEEDFRGRTHFPQYCAGTGVVMTRGVVEELGGAVADTPLFFIEDVYLTGLLAPKLKPPIHYFDLIAHLKLDVAAVKEEYAQRTGELSIFLSQLSTNDLPIIFSHALARIKPHTFKLLTDQAIAHIT